MENGKFQELVLQQFQIMNKRFELVTSELKTLNQRVGAIEDGQSRLEKSQDILATEVMSIKAETTEINTNLTKLAIRIENEIEPKIDALFDGQEQHTKQLGRIEEQVSRHDEYIMKRIKK